jgi:esterase/lipase superfamily enzyme
VVCRIIWAVGLNMKRLPGRGSAPEPTNREPSGEFRLNVRVPALRRRMPSCCLKSISTSFWRRGIILGGARIASFLLAASAILLAFTDVSYAAGSGSAVNLLVWLLLGGGAVGAAGVSGHQVVQRVAKGPDVYHTWYATNRVRKEGVYTCELGDKLQFGTCKVAIPRSHEIGSIGSGKIARAWQRLRTGADDALYIVNSSEWSEAEFLNAAKFALRRQGGKHILVYIHGFKNTFEDAIIRAAQIGFDLKVDGITAAFCWASKGELLGYAADEDTARLSEDHLAEFLALLHSNFPQYTIDILAHSMGNRILMGVLQSLKDPALADARFGQILLAAPDVDARYFEKVANFYPTKSQRTTLYVCARDVALLGSGDIHLDRRVGYTPPITVIAGIDTVDATGVNLDRLGHGYFADAYNVVYDLWLLLHFNPSPTQRLHIVKSQTVDGQIYWSLAAAS